MDGGNLLFDLPARDRQSRKTRREPPVATGRPQPIRDAILDLLTKPHTVKQVAEHIQRRTCIATGHLRAMQAKGLAVRLSWGVWVRQDRCRNAPDPAKIQRNCPVQEMVLKHLTKPRTLDDLLQKTGQSRSKLQHSLLRLQERGIVTRGLDKKIALSASQPSA